MLLAASLNKHVLSIIDKCNSINHLKQLHAHLITLGHGHTHFYIFKLLRFCTLNLSDLAYARHIFDNFYLPNVYMYATMITAYASAFDHSSSFSLYRDMVRENRSKPNHFIFPMILKSCPEVVKPYGTEMLHSQIVKWGFEGYSVVQTALFDAYSRYGADIGVARKIFDEISEKNVVSWTAMISGYMRVAQVGNAVLLFEEMPEGIIDTPCWNSIIGGCMQNGLFPEAIEFFSRMVLEDGLGERNRPNQGTVVCALSACGHSGMLQLGKFIHGFVFRNGLSLDAYVANALIDMYGKCGGLRTARLLFDRCPKVNLTSWNSMINSLALHGESEGAIGIFEEMLQHRNEVKPDGVTFIGLLNACAHGGLVEQGRVYYDLMVKEYGIEPRIEHYGCLIDLLGRAGQFEEAMEFVGRMKIPPDAVVWGSLLNACKIHGRVELAEFVVNKLIELDPSNGGYHSILANLYGELGKWDEARKTRKTLSEQNPYKTPGCSWIEVDNQVHQFSSVDKSHPRTEEIYSILECLVE